MLVVVGCSPQSQCVTYHFEAFRQLECFGQIGSGSLKQTYFQKHCTCVKRPFFLCSSCGSKFLTSWSLRNHLKTSSKCGVQWTQVNGYGVQVGTCRCLLMFFKASSVVSEFMMIDGDADKRQRSQNIFIPFADLYLTPYLSYFLISLRYVFLLCLIIQSCRLFSITHIYRSV